MSGMGNHVTRCKGGYHASDTFGTCAYCGREAGEPCGEAFIAKSSTHPREATMADTTPAPMTAEEIEELRASEHVAGGRISWTNREERLLATIDAKDKEIARLRDLNLQRIVEFGELQTALERADEAEARATAAEARARDAAGDTEHALHQLAQVKAARDRLLAEVGRLTNEPTTKHRRAPADGETTP